MINYRLTVAYDGTSFKGFQKQKNQETVQSRIESAIEKVFKERIVIYYAGRTDAGVHAIEQIINFKHKQDIPLNGLRDILNKILGSEIKVKQIDIESSDFHARKSAVSREYIYLLTEDELDVFWNKYIVQIDYKFEQSVFDQMKLIILGEHDFVRFRKTGSDEVSTIRRVLKFECKKIKMNNIFNSSTMEVYKIQVEANGFLRGMVRLLIGAMNELMKKRISIVDITEMLSSGGDKCIQFNSAPAKGLTLAKVYY